MEQGTIRYHYGLCILRMFMCFEVVMRHFFQPSGEKALIPFDSLRVCAVPIFMTLSFFLTTKTFVKYDAAKLKKRLWRIAVPLVGWGIIYWIAFSLFSCFDNNINVSITDLLFQITTGHSEQLNPSMWFQFDIIVITIVFASCFRYLTLRKARLFLYLLLFLTIAIQYSGVNYFLFGDLRFELKYPLGRIAEMMPYAVIGFELGYNSWLYEKITYKWAIVLLALPTYFYFRYTPILPYVDDFFYGGINIVMSSLCVFFVFSLFPMNSMSTTAKNAILFLSRFTLGIYCCHRMIAYLLQLLLDKLDVTVSSFVYCLLIYLCSFAVCYLISKIPLNICKQIIN